MKLEAIIFLDIDGVLNDEAHRDANPFQLGWHGWLSQLDRDRVSKLNVLLGRTSATLVLSSSWRFNWCAEDISALLAEAGLMFDVVDVTPPSVKNRAEAIARWLALHSIHSHFIILDDGETERELRVDGARLVEFGEHYIQTEDGLEDAHVERAAELLIDAGSNGPHSDANQQQHEER